MKLSWIVIGLFCVATASAQMDPNMDMGTSDSKPMQEMNAGMKKMDHDMAAAPMNGNVDHDFASMMIPHHAGAIDMAKVELAHGKDPAMRKLAQQIITDQEKEIAFMNEWLKKNTAVPSPDKK